VDGVAADLVARFEEVAWFSSAAEGGRFRAEDFDAGLGAGLAEFGTTGSCCAAEALAEGFFSAVRADLAPVACELITSPATTVADVVGDVLGDTNNLSS
jgi:hypothetical protein